MIPKTCPLIEWVLSLTNSSAYRYYASRLIRHESEASGMASFSTWWTFFGQAIFLASNQTSMDWHYANIFNK